MFHRLTIAAALALLCLAFMIALPLGGITTVQAAGQMPDPPVEARGVRPAPPACPDHASLPPRLDHDETVVLPILMYHHLHDLPETATPLSRTLTVSPRAFAEQLGYLAEQGYHTIYFADLIAYFAENRPLPKKPIILTFDDGWRDHYTVAFPTLRAHCMVGVFFPPTNWVDRSNLTLTWSQVEAMSIGEMEFGSHTADHHLLPNQTEQQVTRQLQDSRAVLEPHLRKPVVAFAYPGGAYNADVAGLVSKAGYGAAVTVARGVEHRAEDLFTLRRVTISYADDLTTFAAKLRPPPLSASASAPPVRHRRRTPDPTAP